MSSADSNAAGMEVYVWDKGIRIFHWVNFACVIVLAGLGIILLNGKTLQLTGDAKVMLKDLHVWAGYVFIANLLWRLLCGFIGNQYARWSATLPFGRGYCRALLTQLKNWRHGGKLHYAGHNPAARLMIAALLLVMMMQAATGLILAGTDLYRGPVGTLVADYLDEAGDGSSLVPGSKAGVSADRYQRMRELRTPVVELHEYGFFLLLALVTVHIGAVVVFEIREREGLVSAMISGVKHLRGTPADQNPDSN